MLNNIISKIGALNIFTDLWNTIANNVMKGVYGLYFALVKAIAWILDMLTQLFFIFSGMTPVSSTSPSVSNGEYEKIDIVNFFLTQKSFQKAYLYLCLIALGLIIVFAIGKIIKQDYFDRTGPRSKGPIFRNIALSFIAFICIIPVFYFLIDAAAALALLVMQAMGYKGGGIGTLIFNISWDDGGKSVRAVAQHLGKGGAVTVTFKEALTEAGNNILTFFDPGTVNESRVYDPDNFGWYSKDTFYVYYWNANSAEPNTDVVTFHWYIFIFTGLILIVNLGQMMLAMVTRMYNLIALFIVAPSPISQIVLDDGQRFKGWKDKVVQEALKVVGCVMSFMLFIMIVSVVNNLDLMKFAYTADAATSLSLIEDNNLTTELSDNISAMYYYGDEMSWIDRAINAVGRCMIIIAGVGAIKDIDKTITPFLYGGSSSMDMGEGGKAILAAGGAVANGALAIGRTAISGAVSGASALVSGAAGAGLSALKGVDAGAKAGKGISGATGKGANLADAAKVAGDKAGSKKDLLDTATKLGENKDGASDVTKALGKKEEKKDEKVGTDNTSTENKKPGGEVKTDGVPETENVDLLQAADGTKKVAEGMNNGNVGSVVTGLDELNNSGAIDAAQDVVKKGTDVVGAGDGDGDGDPKTTVTPKNDGDDDGVPAGDPTKTVTPESDGDDDGVPAGDPTKTVTPESDGDDDGSKDTAATDTKSGVSSSDDSQGTRFATMHKQGETSRTGRNVKRGLGVVGGTLVGVRRAAFGITGHTLKTGARLTGTALKTGGKIAGILAKTVLQMTGMGAVAKGVEGFAKGVADDTKKTVGKLGKDLKGQGAKFAKSLPKDSTVGKGMAAASALGHKFVEGGGTEAFFKKTATSVDTFDKRRHRMDDGDKQALDYAAKGGNDSVISTVKSIGSGDSDLSTGATNIVSGATQQLADAQGLNEMSQTYTGTRNSQAVINESQVSQINAAYAQRDAMAQNLDSKGVSQLDRIEAMASDWDGEIDAQERYNRVDSHMGSLEGTTNSQRSRMAHHTIPTESERTKYMQAINARSVALDKRYSSVIEAVDSARKTGTAVDANTVEAYNQYLTESRDLDNAYLYVHSGYGDLVENEDGSKEIQGEGRDSFVALQKELRSSDAFNATGGHHEQAQLDGIAKRAETSKFVRGMADDSLPDVNGLEANASAATKLQAATLRTAAAQERYDAVMAKGSTASDAEKAYAAQQVKSAIAATATHSTALRDHMSGTAKSIVEGSKRNSQINTANADYEKTRGQVEVNIQRMKARNVSAGSIAAAEAALAELDEVANGAGSSARYDDRTRGRSGFTQEGRTRVAGSRRMKVLAKGTGVRAGVAEYKPGADKITTSEARERFDKMASGAVNTVVDVELVEDYDISKGVGSKGLERMASYLEDYNGSEATPENMSKFASAVGGVSVDRIEIDERHPDEVMQAISGISRETLPKGYKGRVSTYQANASARYENAVKSYNSAMESASNLAREYASTQNSSTLEAVKNEIAKAVRSSEEIRILKVELGIDKKD